jgi:hypothetical protein
MNEVSFVVCLGAFGVLLIVVYARLIFILDNIKLEVDYLKRRENITSSELNSHKYELRNLDDRLRVDILVYKGNPPTPVERRFPIQMLMQMIMKNYTVVHQEEYYVIPKEEEYTLKKKDEE